MARYLDKIRCGAISRLRIVLIPAKKMGSGQQLTLEAVTPGMVRTDNVAAVGFGFFDERRTAVNTDIMKCPDDAVGISGQ
jgi:hypothetical protein